MNFNISGEHVIGFLGVGVAAVGLIVAGLKWLYNHGEKEAAIKNVIKYIEFLKNEENGIVSRDDMEKELSEIKTTLQCVIDNKCKKHFTQCKLERLKEKHENKKEEK